MQRMKAIVLCLGLSVGTCSVLGQTEPGKADKYYSYKVGQAIKPGTYPELTIEDLQKICLYSKLAINVTKRGVAVSINDDASMRHIDPGGKRDDVLVVTSDHFQFTVLKHGAFDPRYFHKRERAKYQFLWIKHATRESPDGKPWLKDLILIPYNKETGALTVKWPFPEEMDWQRIYQRTKRVHYGSPICFLKAGDPRPKQAKLPAEHECVIGTFHAGKVSFLVLDVFGCYSWWGKIVYTEYYGLRGKSAEALDRFHAPPKRTRRRSRGYVSRLWTSRVDPNFGRAEVLGATTKDLKRILAALPKLLEAKPGSEKKEGWEDLLRLEEPNQRIVTIDNEVVTARTFEGLVLWARRYASRRNGVSYFKDWYTPLGDLLATNDRGHIATARVLRYVFRSKGFPCVIQGFARSGRPEFPSLVVQVFIPSQGLSWVLNPGGVRDAILDPVNPQICQIPIAGQPVQQRKPIAVFDCHLGGLYSPGRPIPLK